MTPKTYDYSVTKTRGAVHNSVSKIAAMMANIAPALALILGISGAPPFGGSAIAVAQGFDISQIVSVDLVPGWKEKNGDYITAFRVRMAPGWKTYWRSPGDTGTPPQFNWEGSRNIKDISQHWPAPKLFDEEGVRVIGYKDQLILPIRLTPENPQEPITLQMVAQIGVCKEVCIPISFNLSQEMVDSPTRNGQITAALIDAPLTGEEANISRYSCEFEVTSAGIHVIAQVVAPPLTQNGGAEIIVIEYADDSLFPFQGATQRQAETLITSADFLPSDGEGTIASLSREDITLTLIGQNGTVVELKGCPVPARS